MKIQVTLRKKTYGQAYIPSYSMSVCYDDDYHLLSGSIDLDQQEDLVEQISSVLLNQISPVDLPIGTWDEACLYSGETISRLHVAKIIENWEEIDFTKTPWL